MVVMRSRGDDVVGWVREGQRRGMGKWTGIYVFRGSVGLWVCGSVTLRVNRGVWCDLGRVYLWAITGY